MRGTMKLWGVLVAGMVLLWITSGKIGAQSTNGTINGTVRDSTGAAIPNAEITATETATNQHVIIRSQGNGEYTLLNLPPGSYRLSVSAPGFSGYQQTGIVLVLNQHATLDVALHPGSVQEQVVVNADVVELDQTSSALSSEVTGTQISSLPLNTRESYALLDLVPGFYGSIGNDYNNVSYSINGGDYDYGDILVDGTPAGFPTVNGVQGVGIFPSVDAIGEFRLLAQDFPAEFGRTLDGIVNVVYKSGTNHFHGTAFEFIRTRGMDANDFFSNRNGVPLPPFHRNQFGGLLDGPIYRDKTFFLISTELLLQNQLGSVTATVPTALQRIGDFSQSFGPSGAQQVIYDPYTTTYNPAAQRYTRKAYVGNKIMPSELSQVGLNIASYYPLPNAAGVANTNANNFYAVQSTATQTIAWDVRVDHNLSDRQKIFGRYSNRYYDSNPSAAYPGNSVMAEGLINGEDFSRGLTFGYTATINPRTIFDARLGFARTLYDYGNNSLGFQDTVLGLPASIDAAPGVTPLFPQVGPSGYTTLGNNGERHNSFMTYALLSSVSMERGKHIFKFGFDGRMIRVNDNEASYGAGGFSFPTSWTQQDPSVASAYLGNGIASMLLGEGSGYVIQDYKNVATQSYYFAEYAQDDWRITPKLTLNLGVRYDLDTPRTERYNRMNYFNPTVASPLNTAVPGLTGGLVFAGVNGASRHQYNIDFNNVAPRVGFAFSPDASTVVHGGAAIVYGPSTQQAAGTVGPYGFRVQTNWFNSADGVTPYTCTAATNPCLGGNLDNPFPQGFSAPPGSKNGLVTGVGNDMEGILQQDATPYSIQWGLDVQMKLPHSFIADFAYVGNRGRQLIQSSEGGIDFDQLPVSDLSLGATLNQQVANPFYGFITSGTLANTTTSRAQLLLSYPQYLQMWPLRMQGGDSQYDGLQLSLNKRLSSGFQMQASYAWAKAFINGTTHQDSFHPMADYAVSPQDVHHRFVVSYIYQLPFGRGRYFGAHMRAWEDAFVGGWQVNGITTMQTGTPLQVTATNSLSSFNYQVLYANWNKQDPTLTGPVKNRLSKYFNTANFAQPSAYTLGNSPAYVNNLRAPGIDNTDFSLFKTFLAERRVKTEVRAEAFNIANHPQFSSPNTNVSSSSFGIISSQANSPRQIQFGVKVLY